MILTTKQYQIMSVLIKGNEDGSFVDMDQIIQRLPYEPTKQALQFSIRYLIQKGLAMKQTRVKRRGRSRITLSATSLGYAVMRNKPTETNFFGL